MSSSYQSSQQMVLIPIIQTNPRAVAGGMTINSTTVTNPRVSTSYECNTVADIVTGPGTAYKGATEVWYNRTDIGALFLISGIVEPHVERPVDSIDTRDLIDDLNSRYGLVLVSDDIVVSPVTMDDTHVTLQMSPTSVWWTGTLELKIITIYDYPLRKTHAGRRYTQGGKRRLVHAAKREG